MAARLELTLTGDGAAFDTMNGAPAAEVARILRALAASIESGREGQFSLRDMNGNGCGDAQFTVWDEEGNDA